jgi:hypothetical protein
VGVINFRKDCNDITITNVNKQLNQHNGSGISYKITTQRYHTIEKVFIGALKDGYGILISPTVLTSKPAIINDVYIIGAYARGDSIGIGLLDNSADCRLTNVSAMAIKVGLKLHSHMALLENCHFWCGTLSGSDTVGWWSDTKAIEMQNNAYILGSNIYLDSARIYFDVDDNSSANISNLIVWCDNSMEGNENLSRLVTSGYGDGLNKNGYIKVNGGRILASRRMDTVNNRHVYLTDVEVIALYAISDNNPNRYGQYPHYTNKTYSYIANQSITTDCWVEFGRVYISDWSIGSCFGIRHTIYKYVTEIWVTISNRSNITFNLSRVIANNYKYGYQIKGDYIYLYVKESANYTQHVEFLTCSELAKLINYECNFSSTSTRLIGEVLSSDSTSVTEIQ